MKIFRLWSILLLLLLAAVANAQQNHGKCWVNGSFYDNREKIGSGVLLVGKFTIAPSKEIVVKSFHAYENLIVTVNAQYDFVLKNLEPRPDGIRLAIAASNHAATNIFDSVDSSLATTALRNRWNLTVMKAISVDNRLYTFTVGCVDASKPVKRLN